MGFRRTRRCRASTHRSGRAALRHLLERRDLSWAELKADQLATPVAAPDEETLKAWHAANGARFTAPEIRKITYAWLTPDMLAETVQLDETALRDLYQARIAEFQQPERRMVERLVFPTPAAAAPAAQSADKGSDTAADKGTAAFSKKEDRGAVSLYAAKKTS